MDSFVIIEDQNESEDRESDGDEEGVQVVEDNFDEDADIEIEYRFDVSRFARPDLELPASVFVTPIVGRWKGDGVYRPGVVEDDSRTLRPQR